jgi:hypothetical protein
VSCLNLWAVFGIPRFVLLVDHVGELLEFVSGGRQVPREVVDHLSLRQIDVSEVVNMPSNNSPSPSSWVSRVSPG